MNLRTQVIQELKDIPDQRLRVIKDFIEYVKDKQSWKETQEILGSPRMRKEIHEARESWRKGQNGKFTNWDRIKSNV